MKTAGMIIAAYILTYFLLTRFLSPQIKKMKTSKNGVNEIIQSEGKRNKAYKDTKGFWTIGVGHLIKPDEQHLLTATLTDEEITNLLINDLSTAERAVNNLGVPLTQNMFDALVSFTFNVGNGAFTRSTLAKKLKAGDKAGAANQFLVWENKSRRERERNLFLS